MKHMLVRHKVADFGVWKAVFDSHAFVTAPAADKAKDISGVLDEPDCWYLD